MERRCDDVPVLLLGKSRRRLSVRVIACVSVSCLHFCPGFKAGFQRAKKGLRYFKIGRTYFEICALYFFFSPMWVESAENQFSLFCIRGPLFRSCFCLPFMSA